MKPRDIGSINCNKCQKYEFDFPEKLETYEAITASCVCSDINVRKNERKFIVKICTAGMPLHLAHMPSYMKEISIHLFGKARDEKGELQHMEFVYPIVMEIVNPNK